MPGLMEIKLNKRGGNSTPPPTWQIGNFDFQTKKDIILTNIDTSRNSSLSARKLGAFLWERMSHGGAGVHGHRRRKGKEKGSKVAVQMDAGLDIPYDEQPRPSDSSLKRKIAASVIQHHQSVERNSHALQTVSPASYNSSMEVTPFNPLLSPNHFQGREGKIKNSPFNLKTSKELVVVLNRIWTLEEQHASNISLINSMKRELDQSHVRIKGLLREKNKEQERVKAKIKSTREELNDERNLRKQSESLHMKLARELSVTKTSFTQNLKEYKREKNARILLEDLCDEFAVGIRDYEQEVRHLKHKLDKGGGTRESPDRLILHLSEAWLDERMQMKHDNDKGTIVDKLSLEIETFLRAKAAKHSLNGSKLSLKRRMGKSLRRLSSESFHMNDATSAPHNAKDDEHSTSSNSNLCQSRLKEKPLSNTKKKVHSHNNNQGKNVLHKLVKSRVLSLEEETPREDNEVSKATSRWDSVTKQSTLKAKLLEARLHGQHSKAFGSTT